MYIEQVIIDGFKSYAHRTVLDNFDPHFTAITGRNGTGKSNIFDAICFVLGLTNLKMARADNVVNLIYKDGAGGVTKASVTIVFNNTNKAPGHCPVGYENDNKITVTRQIMVGGNKKYLLNGRNAQVQTITNLFHSVQLNVANPHFMIMQGKITSVTNMKAPELLALLEEAAGTRMFETRKKTALLTIERKEQKLKEIDNLLKEEIEPKLARLGEEMTAYKKFQDSQVKLEQLTRLHLAWQYYSSKQNAESGGKRIAEKKKELEDTHDAVRSAQHDQKRLERLIQEQRERRQQESRVDLDGLEKCERESGKQQAVANAMVTNKRKELDQEKNRLKHSQENISEVKNAIAKKERESKVLHEAHETLRSEKSKLQEQVQNRTKALALLNSGVAATEEGLSVSDALMKFEGEKAELSTAVKNHERTMKSLGLQIKERRTAAEKMKDETAGLKQKLDRMEKEYEEHKAVLAAVPFEPEREKDLLTALEDIKKKKHDLQQRLNETQHANSGLRFDYSDPVPGFDRSAVKGLVAQLVRVKDPNTSTAIEVTAGGRLYNVVVTTDSVAAALLKHGLKKRVTLIPLNKIDGTIIDERRQHEAAKLSGDKAHLALSLVGYAAEVDLAMRYIFGRTFICEDAESARLIMTKMQTKAVTLDGDVYDPSGTVTGGAKNDLGKSLKLLEEARKLQAQIDGLVEKEQQTVAALDELRRHKAAYQQKKRQLDQRQQELEQIRGQLQRTSRNQILQECEEIEKQMNALTDKISENRSRLGEVEARLSELNRQKGEFSCSQERIAKANKDLETAKAQLEKLGPRLEEASSNAEEASLDVERSKEELSDIVQRVAEQEVVIARITEELAEVIKRAEQAQQAYQKAKAELSAAKQKLSKANEAIQKLEDELEAAKSSEAEFHLKIKNMEHGLRQLKKEIDDAVQHTERLVRENSWLEQVLASLGKPGGEFDFAQKDMQTVRRQLEELKDYQKNANKTLNQKVVSMFEAVVEESTNMYKKRKQVLTDRKTLEDVIQTLEEEKRKALRQSYEKMNKDFSAIFSSLLPDAEARLDHISKDGELTGLELKVAFSRQWKDSLNQLSGGQRSLMSLSFLLALLKLNPAPMYILDEVDSALDISHTQNIGKMLKTTFKESQFLVISHKEGMFNNANVIFNTDANNGQSFVKRHAR